MADDITQEVPTTVGSSSEKLGLPPGALVHVGEQLTEDVSLRRIRFDAENFEEGFISVEKPLPGVIDAPEISWLDLCGIHDVESVKKIGDVYGLHSLVLEDILNTRQRPKAEAFENYLYVTLKMVRYDGYNSGLDVEHISLIVGKNYVLTFQERPGDVFDPVRYRLKEHKGRIRSRGADYLGYAILDLIVDHYFLALENLSYEIEGIEEEILGNPGTETIEKVHRLRRTAVSLRRAAWPLRETVQKLLRDESDLVVESSRPFLMDLYDHVVQVIDTLEVQRETLGGYVELYLSSISHRMNEVMKVLTIVATIFIPLTFVAGIYGMNFENMPELKWRWGYATAIAAMVAIGASMFVFFKRRKWL